MTPDWCRMMAVYNAEMNQRLYAAATTLEDSVRRADGGAFWGSIHGTLSHLLWGDTLWMSRFDGWTPPGVGMKDSPRLVEEWNELRGRRVIADARIIAWASRLTAADLAAEMRWFSAIVQREVGMPRWIAATHFFNHQTHHRGQAHALVTRAGAATGDTDLPWVLDLAALGLVP
ncbi:DinB family protein [Roseomonas sp. PWR1]|uniref:DinB family protein n=1 Tax=Roseomonas nitratireducens TaxID=2820810 RepID=A0ABS4AWV0_9PROT|nr:DinB family protein [Neoroseomonas nitratireducens]MBP0465842.1 DinB family protein [Neoroseomonas nitratireducens]